MDIKTWWTEGGVKKVKLFQPLPLSFDEFVGNTQLLTQLLTKNGIKDIKSIQIHEMLPGGLNGLNRTGVIIFKNKQPSKKIVIKGNKGGFMAKTTWQLREAWFYERVASQTAVKESGLNCPNTLLNIVDIETGKQIIVMEMLDDCIEIQKIFNSYSNFKPDFQQPWWMNTFKFFMGAISLGAIFGHFYKGIVSQLAMIIAIICCAALSFFMSRRVKNQMTQARKQFRKSKKIDMEQIKKEEDYKTLILKRNDIFHMGVLMQLIADQIAALHISHWCDQELLKNAPQMFPTAQFRLGKEKESFERIKGDLGKGLWLGENLCTTMFKRFHNGAQVVRESYKNLTWDNYQKMCTDPKTKFFCLIHGDCHPKQMLWSKTKKQVNLIDFEFADIGHPAIDLGYFLIICGKEIREKYGESFMKRYWKALIKSGKVTKEEWPYEQMKLDIVAFGGNRLAFVELCYSYWGSNDQVYSDQIIGSFDQWCKDNSRFALSPRQMGDSTYQLPLLFMAPTFSMPMSQPQY